MKTRAALMAISAIAAVLLSAAAAPAARVVTLASGSMVTAKMNSTIDSGSAQPGQRFTMTVVPPYPMSESVFGGATLYGHVAQVVSAGQGRNPQLSFAIDRIRLQDGAVGHPTLMVQSQETQHHNNISNVALTALGGMLVGNWVGKAVFNTNVGGAVGAVAGGLYAANKRTNVSLTQGSSVVFESQRTVALR